MFSNFYCQHMSRKVSCQKVHIYQTYQSHRSDRNTRSARDPLVFFHLCLTACLARERTVTYLWFSLSDSDVSATCSVSSIKADHMNHHFRSWSVCHNVTYRKGYCGYLELLVCRVLLIHCNLASSLQTGSAVTTMTICLLEMCVSLPPQRGKRISTTITPNPSVSLSHI